MSTTSRRCARTDDAHLAGQRLVTIHLTVTDVDAKFQRALNVGATVVTALEDQLWETAGAVADPFTTGRWASWCARSPDEIQAAMSSQRGSVSTIAAPGHAAARAAKRFLRARWLRCRASLATFQNLLWTWPSRQRNLGQYDGPPSCTADGLGLWACTSWIQRRR